MAIPVKIKEEDDDGNNDNYNYADPKLISRFPQPGNFGEKHSPIKHYDE